MPKTYTTQAIAEALNGHLIGNGLIVIGRIAHPSDIRGEHDLALAMDKKLLPLLAKTKARAVLVSKEANLEPGLIDACIVVDRPRLAMARLTTLFSEPVFLEEGIHPSAVIEDGAKIGENVRIGAHVYVGAGAVIGSSSTLHPQVYIGPGSRLGEGSLIYAGARIGAGTVIGDHCIIHFNASIGSDGFSFVTPQPGSVEAAKESSSGNVSATNHELVRIASLAPVVIGNDVEIGANTSIDRGTVASTRIGHGTKIDNQVQIGHNVAIGDNCLICGRTAIAGSVIIGNRVVLGGGTGVADHVTISDDSITMAMSAVAGNVPPRTIVGGMPALPRERVMENHFNISRLKQFFKKIETLTERIDKLERGGN